MGQDALQSGIETQSVDESTTDTSLVPRPFPPPVFDCLQNAKMEGEGLGESRAGHQVDVRVNVRGAVPDHCNSQALH